MKIPENLTKRYYAIGEVAEMLEVNASLLRYWESEFKEIAPKKSSGGKRQYTQDDIHKLFLLYQLVKVKGYTLEGAKTNWKSEWNKKKQLDTIFSKLENVKNSLIALKIPAEEE